MIEPMACKQYRLLLNNRSSYTLVFFQYFKAHVKRNKEFLTDLLATCSANHSSAEAEPLSPIKDISMEMDAESTNHRSVMKLQVSSDLCRMVGGLLTENLTPDTLYNSRFWPVEETISMTVER